MSRHPNGLEAELERFEDRVLGRAISEDTYTAYELWIRRFEMWFDGEEPSLRDMEDFDTMLDDPLVSTYLWVNKGGRPAPDSYSYSARVQAMSAIKMWLRRRYNVDIPEQPNDIVRGGPDEFTPTYLSRERVRETIQQSDTACSCDGCAAALALSYDAVLRASELVQVERGDINLDEQTIYVHATKGSRDSTIVLSDDTVELLSEYIDKSGAISGPLFKNTYDNSWNKSSWASHVGRKHVPEGSHSWGRHTPILHMLQAGVSFGDVYRRARHRSPDTTTRYARYIGVEVPSWAGGE